MTDEARPDSVGHDAASDGAPGAPAREPVGDEAARDDEQGSDDTGATEVTGALSEGTSREPRPMIERIGLSLIAALLAILFGGVSVASWSGGEPFLAVMAGVGCLMTLWVGALTLVRG